MRFRRLRFSNKALRDRHRMVQWVKWRNRKNLLSFFRFRRVFTVSRLFLIPAFLLLVIFVLYPIFDTVYVSFLSEGRGGFVGFENYHYVLFQKVNPLLNLA